MFNEKTYQEVLKEFNVDKNIGLSEVEVKNRKNEYGLNSLKEAKKKPLIWRFLMQFKDVLIIILLIAAIISVIVAPEEWIESLVILVVVLLNAILGVVQESKAEKSLDALKKLSSPSAKVLRSGNIYAVEASSLVPGDIIILEAGDFIPADARIIEQSKLQVDESALTGESVPVSKTIEATTNKNISLGDMKNMLFSSTFITYGRGIAVVVKTGMNTEIGKIASMLIDTKIEATPLQNKLTQIGKVIGIGAIFICIVVFLLGWLLNSEDILSSFKTSIALAVAAIPEGLSTVVTVVLAIGVEKMARQNAIVKRLPAVETLGCTSIVCSDKTGTLTQNKMTVLKTYVDEIKEANNSLNEEEKEMLTFFALCTDAEISFVNGLEKRTGDPTETALIEINNKYGLNNKKIKENFPRLQELSFDSERKMMTVIVRYNDKILSITKGAPDVIINRSKENFNKQQALEANQKMASEALRVLAVAIKYLENIPLEDEMNSETLENNLEFIGLVGMIDPSRPEVKEAIKVATGAGIRTIMITGDHIATASAIARELGILHNGELAITSEELHKMTDEELFKNIEKYSVYARVAPEDKVRIVNTWQAKGMVVSMTGDGVNDSPALKTADIGCAMGITGTDVAKEAAAMILVDDNFATIISAVREGRGIYDNIKKAVKYLLSSNIGEIVTILFASIISAVSSLSFGVPLLPMHLLWVNLITDSLPAFALGLEKPDDKVMKKAPRNKKESFFANKMGFTIIWQGLLIGLLTLTAYIIGHTINPNNYLGQTMAFLTLATLQLFHAFNIKSDHSVFTKQAFNNKYLILAFVLGLGLQLLIIYIPPFASIFKLEALPLDLLILCLGLSLVMVLVCEIVKIANKLRNKKKIKKS
ncbi:MAG: calcium-translocating P-type ATPase, PMCA-type [Bacilli bacterium]|nr:calcium-translocating P-type ATPase, PMCA-type [Bacilli bacterium]